jgi:hypothetical protein
MIDSGDKVITSASGASSLSTAPQFPAISQNLRI